MTSLRLSSIAAFAVAALALNACQKPAASSSKGGATQTLAQAREGFRTKLIKQESEDEAPGAPPLGVFKLVAYPSPAGNLAAYVSPDPGDGKKHPLVIWIVGGFSNSISEIAWAAGMPAENDQSAAAYRKAGIAMMYPSFRGGNNNPGHKEGFYGEVDDVLAAAAYAASLPWVDPARIYLGGHSTGGTLALLAAEAAPAGQFRAVMAFGPVEDVAGYGQDHLPFKVSDGKESRLRAPVEFLGAISAPTFVIEGAEGNSASLEELRKRNRNPKIKFVLAKGQDHFSVLGPGNSLFASKIPGDSGPECRIGITEAEIQAACVKAAQSDLPPGLERR